MTSRHRICAGVAACATLVVLSLSFLAGVARADGEDSSGDAVAPVEASQADDAATPSAADDAVTLPAADDAATLPAADDAATPPAADDAASAVMTVSLTADPREVRVGSSSKLTATVRNTGEVALAAVVITFPAPSGFGTISGRAIEASGKQTCDPVTTVPMAGGQQEAASDGLGSSGGLAADGKSLQFTVTDPIPVGGEFTCSISFQPTRADAGSFVTATASVTATGPDGTAAVLAGDAQLSTDLWVPLLSVGLWSQMWASPILPAGNEVLVGFGLSNTGNYPVSGISVAGQLHHGAGTLSQMECSVVRSGVLDVVNGTDGSLTLDPGEHVACQGIYTIAAADRARCMAADGVYAGGVPADQLPVTYDVTVSGATAVVDGRTLSVGLMSDPEGRTSVTSVQVFKSGIICDDSDSGGDTPGPIVDTGGSTATGGRAGVTVVLLGIGLATLAVWRWRVQHLDASARIVART